MEKCLKCNNLILYDERHDSAYCDACDEWLEEKCDDKNCFYCKDRPDKPSKVIINNNK